MYNLNGWKKHKGVRGSLVGGEGVNLRSLGTHTRQAPSEGEPWPRPPGRAVGARRKGILHMWGRSSRPPPRGCFATNRGWAPGALSPGAASEPLQPGPSSLAQPLLARSPARRLHWSHLFPWPLTRAGKLPPHVPRQHRTEQTGGAQTEPGSTSRAPLPRHCVAEMAGRLPGSGRAPGPGAWAQADLSSPWDSLGAP
uniref:Uncharacterized protein n=1 Tax=Myotis myotis TaxID=51298 RepID=A0A7J7WVX1_MYOMY|nr:hypothetical protein mMyoMyo1_011984 [Myotis myotis]